MKAIVLNNKQQNMKSFLIGFAITILTVLAPIKGLILTIGLAVLVDTAFAIYVSVKLKGIKSFRSHKFFNIAIKTFFYCSAIVMMFLIDKFIFGGSIWGFDLLLTRGLSLLFVYGELKSIDESSMKLGNKSIWTLLKELVNKAKKIKTDINGIVEDKEK